MTSRTGRKVARFSLQDVNTVGTIALRTSVITLCGRELASMDANGAKTKSDISKQAPVNLTRGVRSLGSACKMKTPSLCYNDTGSRLERFRWWLHGRGARSLGSTCKKKTPSLCYSDTGSHLERFCWWPHGRGARSLGSACKKKTPSLCLI